LISASPVFGPPFHGALLISLISAALNLLLSDEDE
jgi:hypothetical protein